MPPLGNSTEAGRDAEGETGEVDVFVNGNERRTAARTLAELLVELGYGDQRVATAVDGEFIPVADRPAAQLKDGNQIEIVSPRQGG